MKRALLLLAAAACVTPAMVEAPADLAPLRPLVVDRTIHGDTRFNREERWIVEGACESWRRFSAGRVHLVVVWDYSEESYLGLAERPHLVRSSTAPPGVGGVVIGDEIRVVPNACPELYPCVLHELGHFAGLEHVTTAGAVMAPRNPGWLFKAADRLECQRVGLCEVP